MYRTLFTKRRGSVHLRRGTPLTSYAHKLLNYKHIPHLFATLPNTRHVILLCLREKNEYVINLVFVCHYFPDEMLTWRGDLPLVPCHIAPAAPITLAGIYSAMCIRVGPVLGQSSITRSVHQCGYTERQHDWRPSGITHYWVRIHQRQRRSSIYSAWPWSVFLPPPGIC